MMFAGIANLRHYPMEGVEVWSVNHGWREAGPGARMARGGKDQWLIRRTVYIMSNRGCRATRAEEFVKEPMR
jgi:hypothetical protein